MRTRFGWSMLVIVVSVAALSGRVSGEHDGRGNASDPATACRRRDGADNTAAKGVAPALVGARTVFLISELPPADNGRSTDELRHELQRWHRWEEVPHREAADVTLSMSVIRGEGGGSTLSLGIRARVTGTVLWVSSGHDVTSALKALEDRLPSVDGVCVPAQVL